jgi:hypothetical protein
MDSYNIIQKLNTIADAEPSFKNMSIKYETKTGNIHNENFTDFKKFMAFLKHVKSDPDVVDYHASYTEKRMKNDLSS